MDMKLVGVDVEPGINTDDTHSDVNADRPAIGENGRSESVDERGRLIVSESTNDNEAVVAQTMGDDGKSAIVAASRTDNVNRQIVDKELELKGRIAGRPWKHMDVIHWLLDSGWKPTRWEKDGDVTEYPVEGGIRLALTNGQVQEWSPDGVLTLHGVKGVILKSGADNE